MEARGRGIPGVGQGRASQGAEPAPRPYPGLPLSPGDGQRLRGRGAHHRPLSGAPALVDDAAGGRQERTAAAPQHTHTHRGGLRLPGPLLQAPQSALAQGQQSAACGDERSDRPGPLLGEPGVRVLQVLRRQVRPGHALGGAGHQESRVLHQGGDPRVAGEVAQLPVVLLHAQDAGEEDADAGVAAHVQPVLHVQEGPHAEVGENRQERVEARFGRPVAADPAEVGSEPQIPCRVGADGRDAALGQALQAGEAGVPAGLPVEVQHPSVGGRPHAAGLGDESVDRPHPGQGRPVPARRLGVRRTRQKQETGEDGRGQAARDVRALERHSGVSGRRPGSWRGCSRSHRPCPPTGLPRRRGRGCDRA